MQEVSNILKYLLFKRIHGSSLIIFFGQFLRVKTDLKQQMKKTSFAGKNADPDLQSCRPSEYAVHQPAARTQ